MTVTLSLHLCRPKHHDLYPARPNLVKWGIHTRPFPCPYHTIPYHTHSCPCPYPVLSYPHSKLMNTVAVSSSSQHPIPKIAITNRLPSRPTQHTSKGLTLLAVLLLLAAGLNIGRSSELLGGSSSKLLFSTSASGPLSARRRLRFTAR